MHVETETAADDDAADLVLLHGGIGTGRYHWSKCVPALAEVARLHLPDLPGHGSTPLDDEAAYGRALLVDAVERFLDGLDPPVHVMAFSMGGHTAMALAARRPELFASLVLIGVSVREHAGLDGWRNRFDPDELAERYPVWARALSKLHAPLGSEDAWRDVCRRDSRGMAVDLEPAELAGLDCPVLLVRGDGDPAVDPAQYAELRGVLPDVEEFVVPGGGHDVQLTRSSVVAPVLADWVRRQRG